MQLPPAKRFISSRLSGWKHKTGNIKIRSEEAQTSLPSAAARMLSCILRLSSSFCRLVSANVSFSSLLSDLSSSSSLHSTTAFTHSLAVSPTGLSTDAYYTTNHAFTRHCKAMHMSYQSEQFLNISILQAMKSWIINKKTRKLLTNGKKDK